MDAMNCNEQQQSSGIYNITEEHVVCQKGSQVPNILPDLPKIHPIDISESVKAFVPSLLEEGGPHLSDFPVTSDQNTGVPENIFNPDMHTEVVGENFSHIGTSLAQKGEDLVALSLNEVNSTLGVVDNILTGQGDHSVTTGEINSDIDKNDRIITENIHTDNYSSIYALKPQGENVVPVGPIFSKSALPEMQLAAGVSYTGNDDVAEDIVKVEKFSDIATSEVSAKDAEKQQKQNKVALDKTSKDFIKSRTGVVKVQKDGQLVVTCPKPLKRSKLACPKLTEYSKKTKKSQSDKESASETTKSSPSKTKSPRKQKSRKTKSISDYSTKGLALQDPFIRAENKSSPEKLGDVDFLFDIDKEELKVLGDDLIAKNGKKRRINNRGVSGESELNTTDSETEVDSDLTEGHSNGEKVSHEALETVRTGWATREKRVRRPPKRFLEGPSPAGKAKERRQPDPSCMESPRKSARVSKKTRARKRKVSTNTDSDEIDDENSEGEDEDDKANLDIKLFEITDIGKKMTPGVSGKKKPLRGIGSKKSKQSRTGLESTLEKGRLIKKEFVAEGDITEDRLKIEKEEKEDGEYGNIGDIDEMEDTDVDYYDYNDDDDRKDVEINIKLIKSEEEESLVTKGCDELMEDDDEDDDTEVNVDQEGTITDDADSSMEDKRVYKDINKSPKPRGRKPGIKNKKKLEGEKLVRKLRKALGKTNKTSKVVLLYCAQCDVDFNAKYAEGKHDCGSGGTKVQCELCRLFFRSKKSVLNHMQLKHSVSQSIACVCGEVSLNKREAKAHHQTCLKFKIFNGQDRKTRGPYPCEMCGESLNTVKLYTSHMKQVHNTVKEPHSYICKVCGKEFARVTSLLNHEKYVHTSPSIQCPFCEKKVKNKVSLLYHIQTHREIVATLANEDMKPVMRTTHNAPQLQTQLQDGNPLVTFEEMVLSQEPDFKYHCPLCDHKYNGAMHMKAHILKGHGMVSRNRGNGNQNSDENNLDLLHGGMFPNPRWLCQLCGKQFYQKNAYNDHVAIHNGKATQECHLCGRQFITKTAFQRHMRFTHSVYSNGAKVVEPPQKQVECPTCGTMLHKSGFKKHMDKHNGVYRFTCSVCGKKCRSHYDLQNHERTHTGEQPYSCEICGRKFGDRANLRHHEKRIHNQTAPKKSNIRVVGFHAM